MRCKIYSLLNAKGTLLSRVLLHTDKMSHSSRYFINQLQDYQKQNVQKETAAVGQHLYDVIDEILTKQPANTTTADGGLYVGAAGIAYMFLHLSKRKQFKDQKSELISHGLKYLAPALKFAERHGDSKKDKSSFLLGNAGIYAIAAALAKSSEDNSRALDYAKRYAEAADNCKPMKFLSCGGDELFVGRAGYLFGALWLNNELDDAVVPLNVMHEIARVIVESGQRYSAKRSSPCPLMYSYYDTEYLGAAHGLCSILQILIQIPEFLERDPTASGMVRASVDYLLGLQTQSGNFPCAMDEVGRHSRSEDDELVHWCHGAPGVVYLMGAAYLHWKDERYLKACYQSSELTWRKGLLKKGPGICHGVAGGGYVFLLLYRLTQDPKYLHRAAAFANFLNTSEFHREARKPDSPYSLYEGLAGTACFLADLVEPENAAFPFQNIF